MSELESINVNQWEEFKNQPESYQKDFIQQKLQEGTTKTALGMMLGTSRNSINRLISKLGIEEEQSTNTPKTSQKADNGILLAKRVEILENQFKQLQEAFRVIQNDSIRVIQSDSEEVIQNDSDSFNVKKYERKGAYQRTVRLHPAVNEKLERFYQEHEAINKGDLLNSLLDWALDNVLK